MVPMGEMGWSAGGIGGGAGGWSAMLASSTTAMDKEPGRTPVIAVADAAMDAACDCVVLDCCHAAVGVAMH